MASRKAFRWAAPRGRGPGSSTPNPPGGGLFAGVAATSASNAWAVGQTDSADQQTLIVHWNGAAWS
jgi:hypothetical protein